MLFSKFFLNVSHISRRRNAHTRLSQRAHRAAGDDLCLSPFVIGRHQTDHFFFFFSLYWLTTHYISPLRVSIIYRRTIVKCIWVFPVKPFELITSRFILYVHTIFPLWYFGRELVKYVLDISLTECKFISKKKKKINLWYLFLSLCRYVWWNIDSRYYV